MHYCGAVPTRGALQLAMLEEVRTPEPPIRLSALFFEPGSAAQVAAELRGLGDVVVALGAPLSGEAGGERAADVLLARLGVAPQRRDGAMLELAGLLGLSRFSPESGADGPEGGVWASTGAALLATRNAAGVATTANATRKRGTDFTAR